MRACHRALSATLLIMLLALFAAASQRTLAERPFTRATPWLVDAPDSAGPTAPDTDRDGLPDAASLAPAPAVLPPQQSGVSVAMLKTGQYESPSARLRALGFAVTMITTTSTITDFLDYDIVYLPINWAQGDIGAYDEIEAHAEDYRAFVFSGGGLFVDQPNPFGQPGEPVTPGLLPYSITFDSNYTNNDYPPRVIDPDHYLTKDLVPEDLPFPADWLTGVDAAYHTLVVGKVTNLPSLLIAEYGAGRILVQAANSSSSATNAFSDEAYQRMLHWVSRTAFEPAPTATPTKTASPTAISSASPTPTATSTPAVTSTPRTVDLNPANTTIRDTDMNAWSMDEVQPTVRRNRLFVRQGIYNALSWFDIADVVPAGATIQSATLHLYLSYYEHLMTQSPRVSVHRVQVPWGHLQATWNERLTDTEWQAGGCSGAGDREAVAAAATTVSAVNRWYEWDVTALVQGWATNPASNSGMLLVSDSPRELRFYSADDADQRWLPFLRVTYTVGGTPPTPTQTPTFGPSPTPDQGIQLTLLHAPGQDVGLKLGETIQYTIAYANAGSTSALQSWVSCPVPAGTLYVVGSATAGGLYDASSAELRWYLGDLSSGAAGQVSFAVRVNAIPLSFGATAPGASSPQIVNEGARAVWGLPPNLRSSESNTVTNLLDGSQTYLLLPWVRWER